MRLIAVGPEAVLVEVAGPAAAGALAAWGREHVAARDVVPAAATVLFDGVDPAGLRVALEGFAPRSQPEGPRVEVSVRFDGPDLAEVAQAVGSSTDQVIADLLAAELSVAFCGFVPGFAYLVGVPGHLQLPRRATPRTRVEPGSLAIAGEYAGIYPTASPGGWHLIGSTDAVLWDPARTDPALLAPGCRVALVAR